MEEFMQGMEGIGPMKLLLLTSRGYPSEYFVCQYKFLALQNEILDFGNSVPIIFFIKLNSMKFSYILACLCLCFL